MVVRVAALFTTLAFGLWVVPASTAISQNSEPGRGQWVPSWRIVFGGYRQVSAFAVIDASEGWGLATTDIGTSGRPWLQTAFVHFTNGDSAAEQVVNNLELRAIAMAGPEFGLAVGRDGDVYRFDGRIWRPMESPVSYDLMDVELLAPDDGWVVGDRGTILRWDGRSLEIADSPVELIRIVALDMVASDRGWAVTKDGRILVYDGAWAVEDAPEIRELTDVSFRDDDYGLAVGLGVLERVGGRWRRVETAARWTVSVAWEGDVAYVVADDAVHTFIAGQWAPIRFETGPVSLQSLGYRYVFQGHDGVWAMAPDGVTVWVQSGVGAFVWPTISSLHAIGMVPGDRERGWSGGRSITHAMTAPSDGTWRSRAPRPSGWDVTQVSLVSADDGWAIVQSEVSQFALWRLQSGEWIEWPVDKLWQLIGIDMLSADDGWAVGSGVVARWNGSEWQPVVDAPVLNLTGAISVLQGGDSPEVWLGAVGAIHHLKDGEWATEELPRGVSVKVIDVPAGHIGWATDTEDVFRYDGSEWQRITLPVSGRPSVRDLHAPTPSDVWILTYPNGLLHWSPVGWELHALTALGPRRLPLRVRAIPFSSADQRGTDVWLGGNAPTLARYTIVAAEVQLYVPITRND